MGELLYILVRVTRAARVLVEAEGGTRSPDVLPDLIERLGHFRRHVVLIVLGEHFLRDKHAVAVHPPVRNDSLPLTKQVGQDPDVLDGNFLRAVRDDEAGRQCAIDPFDGSGFDQAAQSELAAGRNRLFGQVAGTLEIQQVFLQGECRDRGRQAHARKDQDNGDQPSFTSRSQWSVPLSVSTAVCRGRSCFS